MIFLIANMRVKNIALSLLLVLLNPSICARTEIIIESDTLAKIHDFIPLESHHRKTLVILDLDNTCVEPEGTQFGSDQWFSAAALELQNEGKTFTQAIELILPICFATRVHLPFQPIETITVQTIKHLQNTVMVLGLTARSPLIQEITHNSLKTIGINFSLEAIHPCNIHLTKEKPFTKHATYYQGILYVSENHKGDLLMQFLDSIQYVPELIICVDDKLRNITAINDVASQRNINFVGIRFNKLDEKVKNFTLKHTHQQQKEFEEKYRDTILHFKQQIN